MTFQLGDRVFAQRPNERHAVIGRVTGRPTEPGFYSVTAEDGSGTTHYVNDELTLLPPDSSRDGHRPPPPSYQCDRLSARWANGQVRHNCCLVKEHKGTCTCSCGDQLPPDPPTTEIAVGDTVRVNRFPHRRGYVTEVRYNGDFFRIQFLGDESYTFHKNVVHLVAKSATPAIVDSVVRSFRRNGYRIVKLANPTNYSSSWAHGEAYIEDNQARPLLVVTEELK